MGDKDIEAIVRPLTKLSTLFVCARINSPRSRDPYAMVQEIGFLGVPSVAEESLSDALDTALSHASPDDLVCFTGSLYLVAEARELILGESVMPA
jgi:dihydrofolate synthase / folylpolyglutamate synthase